MKISDISSKDKLIFLVSFVFLTSYVMLYPQIFPDASLRIPLNESEISERTENHLIDLGFSTSDLIYFPRLVHNSTQLSYLQKQFGLEKTNEIIKKGEIPVYFWKVRVKNKLVSDDDFSLSFGSEEKNVSSKGDALSDTINVSVTTGGEIIGFAAKLDNKRMLNPVSLPQAFEIAAKFLSKHIPDFSENYFRDGSDSSQFIQKSLSEFQWEKKSLTYGQKETIKVSVKNGIITNFVTDLEPPKSIKKESGYKEVEGILKALLLFSIVIFMVILSIQKLRKDKVDLKSNMRFGVFVTLAWILLLINNIATDIGDSNKIFIILLPLVFTAPFIFIAFIGGAGVSESEGREVWAGKLLTFDGLRKGRILFPQFSMAIFRGFALAFISAGTLVILLKLFDFKYDFFMLSHNKNLFEKITYYPLIYVVSWAIMNTSFGEIVFRLFFPSVFRKKIRSQKIIILLSTLIWIFAVGGYSPVKLSSFWLTQTINAVLGIYLVLFFLKSDFMTVLWGSFSYFLLRELFPFIYLGDSALFWNGFAMWMIFAVVLFVAVLGFRKKADISDIQNFVPDYLIRQEERERVKRELEIARRVQSSFLPRKKPTLSGIDIASACIPATEVGGDYFDFIALDENRLGVVIGDVSGKGISAAFHMTLTKGFLKSQAKTVESPREVLIHLNELFYENVERTTFISMIYGIFDIRNKKFTFARAGHNPLLLKKDGIKDVEILCPKGLALGLEKGELFQRVIEEYSIGINSKDVFMFYTDGFSEAMNNKKEEFGEDRLKSILNKVHSISAENIMAETKSQVLAFVNNADQHDDMTMIIVKIL